MEDFINQINDWWIKRKEIRNTIEKPQSYAMKICQCVTREIFSCVLLNSFNVPKKVGKVQKLDQNMLCDNLETRRIQN